MRVLDKNKINIHIYLHVPSNSMKQKDANLTRTNVFQASEDSYVSGAILDDAVLYNSPHHKLVKKSNGKYVILDPLAPDFKDIVLDRGETQAPDEILEAIKPLALKIPLLSRDDFGPEGLPPSNLLRSIHLYSNVTKMVLNSLDETALLTLGMAVELWADELIGDGDPLMYLQSEDATESFPPESLDYEDILDEFEDEISSSEEEILPPQLLESDTDDEISKFTRKRQKLTDIQEMKSSQNTSSSDESDSHSSSDSETSTDSKISQSNTESNAESDGESVSSSTKPNQRNNFSTQVLSKSQSPPLRLSDSPESEVDRSLYQTYEQAAPNLDFYDSEAENQDESGEDAAQI